MKSNPFHRALLCVALAAFTCAAHADAAQERANQERCNAMNASVQRTFTEAIHKRLPKQDPGSFIQDGWDIKGLLRQNVSGGLSKLMNLNFGNIIDSLVSRAMESVNRRAQAAFSSAVNQVLRDHNLPGVTLQGVTTNGIPNLSTFEWGPASQDPNLPPQIQQPPIPEPNIRMPPAPPVTPPTSPRMPAVPATNPYTRQPSR